METSRMVIDTNIFISHLRATDKTQTTFHKLPDSSRLFISSVTIYELFMGATSKEKWQDVQNLTDGFPVLSFTGQVAERSAQIFHELKKVNKLIEFRDIFIAATALIYQLPILTANPKDFKKVKGIEIILS